MQVEKVPDEVKKYNPAEERELRNFAADYLYNSINSAIKTHNGYVNSYGPVSFDEAWQQIKNVANHFDFSEDGQGVTTLNEMADILSTEYANTEKLKKAASKRGAFESMFERIRKVPYSPQNIENLKLKSEEYSVITAYNDKYQSMVDGFSEVNAILKQEKEYKAALKYTKGPAAASLTPPEISSHEKFGQVLLDFCNGDKQIVSEYMKTLTSKMGSKEEIEKNLPKIIEELQTKFKAQYETQLKGKSYEQYTKEYGAAYKKAFGGQDCEKMAQAYVESQRTAAGYLEMGTIIATSLLLPQSRVFQGGVKALSAKVGSELAAQLVKGGMTVGMATMPAVTSAVGTIGSEDGFTEEKTAEILEKWKSGLLYGGLGAYASGPLGNAVENIIKTNPNVIKNAMAKVLSDSTTISKTASAVAKTSGVVAETSADVMFDILTNNGDIQHSLSQNGVMNMGMMLVGGRIARIHEKLENVKIEQNKGGFVVKDENGKMMLKTDDENVLATFVIQKGIEADAQNLQMAAGQTGIRKENPGVEVAKKLQDKVGLKVDKEKLGSEFPKAPLKYNAPDKNLIDVLTHLNPKAMETHYNNMADAIETIINKHSTKINELSNNFANDKQMFAEEFTKILSDEFGIGEVMPVVKLENTNGDDGYWDWTKGELIVNKDISTSENMAEMITHEFIHVLQYKDIVSKYGANGIKKLCAKEKNPQKTFDDIMQLPYTQKLLAFAKEHPVEKGSLKDYLARMYNDNMTNYKNSSDSEYANQTMEQEAYFLGNNVGRAAYSKEVGNDDKALAGLRQKLREKLLNRGKVEPEKTKAQAEVKPVSEEFTVDEYGQITRKKPSNAPAGLLSNNIPLEKILETPVPKDFDTHDAAIKYLKDNGVDFVYDYVYKDFFNTIGTPKEGKIDGGAVQLIVDLLKGEDTLSYIVQSHAKNIIEVSKDANGRVDRNSITKAVYKLQTEMDVDVYNLCEAINGCKDKNGVFHPEMIDHIASINKIAGDVYEVSNWASKLQNPEYMTLIDEHLQKGGSVESVGALVDAIGENEILNNNFVKNLEFANALTDLFKTEDSLGKKYYSSNILKNLSAPVSDKQISAVKLLDEYYNDENNIFGTKSGYISDQFSSYAAKEIVSLLNDNNIEILEKLFNKFDGKKPAQCIELDWREDRIFILGAEKSYVKSYELIEILEACKTPEQEKFLSEYIDKFPSVSRNFNDNVCLYPLKKALEAYKLYPEVSEMMLKNGVRPDKERLSVINKFLGYAEVKADDSNAKPAYITKTAGKAVFAKLNKAKSVPNFAKFGTGSKVSDVKAEQGYLPLTKEQQSFVFELLKAKDAEGNAILPLSSCTEALNHRLAKLNTDNIQFVRDNIAKHGCTGLPDLAVLATKIKTPEDKVLVTDLLNNYEASASDVLGLYTSKDTYEPEAYIRLLELFKKGDDNISKSGIAEIASYPYQKESFDYVMKNIDKGSPIDNRSLIKYLSLDKENIKIMEYLDSLPQGSLISIPEVRNGMLYGMSSEDYKVYNEIIKQIQKYDGEIVYGMEDIFRYGSKIWGVNIDDLKALMDLKNPDTGYPLLSLKSIKDCLENDGNVTAFTQGKTGTPKLDLSKVDTSKEAIDKFAQSLTPDMKALLFNERGTFEKEDFLKVLNRFNEIPYLRDGLADFEKTGVLNYKNYDNAEYAIMLASDDIALRTAINTFPEMVASNPENLKALCKNTKEYTNMLVGKCEEFVKNNSAALPAGIKGDDVVNHMRMMFESDEGYKKAIGLMDCYGKDYLNNMVDDLKFDELFGKIDNLHRFVNLDYSKQLAQVRKQFNLDAKDFEMLLSIADECEKNSYDYYTARDREKHRGDDRALYKETFTVLLNKAIQNNNFDKIEIVSKMYDTVLQFHKNMKPLTKSDIQRLCDFDILLSDKIELMDFSDLAGMNNDMLKLVQKQLKSGNTLENIKQVFDMTKSVTDLSHLGFREKFEVLDVLSAISAEDAQIYKANGYDVETAKAALTKMLNVQKNYIRTEKALQKDFLKEIIANNNPYAENLMKTVDLTQFKDGLPLRYSRDAFNKDLDAVLSKLDAPSRSRVLEHFDITMGKEGFEGIPVINKQENSKLSPQEAEAAAIIQKYIEEFTTKNETIINDPDLKKMFDGLIKGFPEFVTITGKRQHGTHDYTVDIHTLKVLQTAMNDPIYAELSDKDKTILKITALVHDFGKKGGVVDPGHALLSANYANNLLAKFNMPGSIKQRIVSLIDNHHWFEKYNTGQMNAQLMAAHARNPEDYKISVLMAKADFSSVNEDFHLQRTNTSNKEEFDTYMDDKVKPVEDALYTVRSKANILIDTPFTQGQKKFPVQKAVIDGVETDLRVLNMTDGKPEDGLFEYGFAPGVTKENARFTVHMPHQDSELASSMNTFFLLSSFPVHQSVQSTSVVSLKNNRTYCNRKFGFVLNQDSANISTASYHNLGSGTGKSIENFANDMFRDWSPDRIYVREQFKKSLSEKGIKVSDEEYAELAKYLYSKKYITQIRDFEINGKVYKAQDLQDALNTSLDTLFKGNEHSEIVSINPRVAGLIARVSKLEDCPPEFLKFAKENNLPIVLIGYKGP